MVFKSTFKSAMFFSDVGKLSEVNIEPFIPVQPTESVTRPPHDPAPSFTPRQQDPKIIRETSPQAKILFDLVSSITDMMGNSAKENDDFYNTPSTTTDTASTIMSEANKTSETYPKTTPKPDRNDDLNTKVPDVEPPPPPPPPKK